MTDRILVSGIEAFGYHGVQEDEKRDGQLFCVDVELELDLRGAAASDELGDTVDYGDLTSRVSRLVSEQRWNLIETVAQKVADLVLEHPMVTATTVTVHKPQAPIDVPFRDVTVTVRRSQ